MWNDMRKKKLNIRIREKGFDFTMVLKKASLSDFLRSSKWFSFDWIIENQSNYLRVIEGNYDNKKETKIDGKQQTGPTTDDLLRAGKQEPKFEY